MGDEPYAAIAGGIFQLISTAAARKRIFALRAEKEERSDLAILLRAMAASEQAQAQRILFLLRGIVGTTAENVAEILEIELPRVQKLFRLLDGEGARLGMVSLRHLAAQETKVGKKSAALLQKRLVDQGRAATYHVCSFCGYLHEDEAPEVCPVCQAPRKRFRRID